MEAVAPSPDSTADLIKNLSIDSTIEVPESRNKSVPAFSTLRTKKTSQPFYPNADVSIFKTKKTSQPFYPNADVGYPSPYYYGGYGDQGSRYVNLLDGGMTQGVYGDAYMYHQGYDFTPYAVYPPVSSAAAMQHNSASIMQHNGQLYGLQQYQYPYSYFQDQVFKDGSYAPIQNHVTLREISSSATVSHAPTSVVMNKENMVNVVNGYPGTRFGIDGTQSAIPSNALMQSNHGATFGSSSPMAPGKDFSPQMNQNLALSLPHYMVARPSTGMELVSDFTNSLYPNNVYCQYGNTWSSFPYGSAAYGSRAGYVPGRVKPSSNNRGGRGNWKKNMDGFNEMSKGPRATNSDNKSDDDNTEVPLDPLKEQYNGEDLSENYSGAKIFVIKSYSEDDIHKSIKYSVWASTSSGNRKLNAAYEEAKEKLGGCPVFLLFSVNSSGQFVGLAEMVGPVDFESNVEYWQQDRWTGCFPVKWHIIKDVPNNLLRKITLENNENRPVTNSRDTQEVMFEKGIQILNLFKGHPRKTCMLDDFDFYEDRENQMQETKSKDHQPSIHIGEHGDARTNETDKPPECVGGTSANQSAPASLESKASP
ncbi:hypothetical protein K1719_007707 [Acacia pycnantha]|nr:hypothetical protein K1719_007707 [Acacia pycnantha]